MNSVEWKNVDYNHLWLEEMGFYDSNSEGRLVNDQIEETFWEGVAEGYSQTNNLFRTISGLGDAIFGLLQKDDVVWEIGSGSGNFTIPMSQRVAHVLGIEPSKAMLAAANKRVREELIYNISFLQSKWEDFSSKEAADVVLSINSFYRIRDISEALHKMSMYAKRRCIIVRSISRSPFFEICQKANISCHWCKDYILIPNILWQQGVAANVSYLTRSSTKRYKNMDEVYRHFPGDISTEEIGILEDIFLSCAVKDGDGYVYPFLAQFVIIWWDV